MDRPQEPPTLPKAPTGIDGLDEITGGGLPRGRPSLICGSAGCGKTLMAMEFLVRGALEFGEPGVFMAFEETADELAQNVRSLGFDLDELIRAKKLSIDFVQMERSEIEETGEYDLEGLFIRLNHGIETIGAKRVVLDTIETLFGGLSNAGILRSELRRLFRWLKDKGVTPVITGERGDGQLTRQGLEEYVSDCVIMLDHRVTDQRSTRRLRIVKYRGSLHGTNEYPFLIEETGIVVVPITSLGLRHQASTEILSAGLPKLDAMLGGGIYRGSTVLVSGTAGTGKTSLASQFAHASCRRGERCLYLAFEECESQLVRNMRSVGVDLQPWIQRGLLRFHATRPTAYGLEMHLALVHRLVDEFDPRLVVVDPITNFLKAGTENEAEAMLTRMIDFLKARQISALFTSLTHGGNAHRRTLHPGARPARSARTRQRPVHLRQRQRRRSAAASQAQAVVAQRARQEQEKAAAERVRIDEQTKDIIQGLRGLGFRAEESRRAAQLSETMANASLEERMRAALSCFHRGATPARSGLASGVGAGGRCGTGAV